jgi:type II secretory pathway pseudopilin PulG
MTIVELVVVLGLLALGVAGSVPTAGGIVTRLRVEGAVADLYAAIHLTRARARATGVMHALEPDGRTFRIEEDPAGAPRTVVGPLRLIEGVSATGNVTLRFSPKGFAVPFGTITVRAGPETRRLVVNILGRVRVATG